MPRSCSICAREDVEQINQDIFNNVPFETMRDKYGASVGALHRHKEHTKMQYMAAKQVEATIQDPSAVMQRIAELDQRAEALYKSAVKAEDRLNATRALKEMREILTLYARMTGELNQQATVVHQHLHISPEWASLRSVMLQALQPYPEARAALIAALEGQNALMEGDGNVE